jgi:hypothetical protein
VEVWIISEPFYFSIASGLANKLVAINSLLGVAKSRVKRANLTDGLNRGQNWILMNIVTNRNFRLYIKIAYYIST